MSATRTEEIPAPATVFVYPARTHEPEHEMAVMLELGKRLASMQKIEFGGLYRANPKPDCPVYLLPTDTIIGIDQAKGLGIHDETQLFGGVAPHAFIPTKAITHGLFAPDAQAPPGWSTAFSKAVRDSVLSGATAFSPSDAIRAGNKLLQDGPIRLKPVHATAGRGQVMVTNSVELQDALQSVDLSRIAECGLVVEEHLEAVETFSVGQVRVAGMVATYVGTQGLTRDNQREEVYGGSELVVARGDFDRLLELDLPAPYLTAITKARTYDHAAAQCFPGFFASRRNYDVARGKNARGQERWGVLEQSWRVGGASAAEILALEAFHADPQCQAVRARTVERFGEGASIPTNAVTLFSGVDSRIGLLTKYAMVEAYGN